MVYIVCVSLGLFQYEWVPGYIGIPGGKVGGGGGAFWSTVYRCVNKGPQNLP